VEGCPYAFNTPKERLESGGLSADFYVLRGGNEIGKEEESFSEYGPDKQPGRFTADVILLLLCAVQESAGF